MLRDRAEFPDLPGHARRRHAELPAAAEDGSPPDDLLYLLSRTGEPRDLGATVREWHDLAVTTARMAQDVRAVGLGGFGSLIEASPSGTTVTRTDARLRISGPDRYRVDYLRRANRAACR